VTTVRLPSSKVRSFVPSISVRSAPGGHASCSPSTIV
jgi:hypothetical protein